MDVTTSFIVCVCPTHTLFFACGILSSLTRDYTWAPNSGSIESQPLDYWGIPFPFFFNFQVFYFRYALCKECIFVSLSLKRVFIIKTDMFVGTSVIYAVFSLFSPCLWLWELFTISFFSSVLEGLVLICIPLVVNSKFTMYV